MEALAGAGRGARDRTRTKESLPKMASRCIGTTNGHLSDLALREAILRNAMNNDAFIMTQQRTLEESEANTPGAATSIFKLFGAELAKERLELQLKIRGTQGLGWEGPSFEEEALSMTRLWLESKAASIAGGSNEVQLNIIAKRVLGLPD